jgi:indolepyruvate decarboxylase
VGHANTVSIGKYLADRLQQVGLKHIFGVPGDYVLGFFKYLEESPIQVVCTCNELNAGYAADAYARLNGVGAACVTYGVGGLSIFNAAAGAYAERVPLIVISGGPGLAQRPGHMLLHHTIGDMKVQLRAYEQITAASIILTSPEKAPEQIDETISTCLRSRRPVYIEIPVDMVDKPCRKGGPIQVDKKIPSDREALAEAIAETAAMLGRAKKPVVIAGIETHRLGLQMELEQIIDLTGYPFVTTLLSKSVIQEQHPQFAGLYCGKLGRPDVCRFVEDADAILCLGVLMTDLDLGGHTSGLDASKMIVANADSVGIRHHVYQEVSLSDFLEGLQASLAGERLGAGKVHRPAKPKLNESVTPTRDRKITCQYFYERVNHFLRKNDIVLADAGDSLFNAANMVLPEGATFIGQAFYVSIGYSVPATMGIKMAVPDRRTLTFVGDGAFQMTVQEVSTLIRNRLDPIIFVMNNDGYTIERMLHDGAFNDLQMWKYHRLPDVFGGGHGYEVRTEGDLEDALRKIETDPDALTLIEVHLDRLDCSQSLKNLKKNF